MRSSMWLRRAASGGSCRRIFAPVSTVRHHFYRMRNEGVFVVVSELLAVASRIVAGREAKPTAAIIDSQSVKTIESGAEFQREVQHDRPIPSPP